MVHATRCQCAFIYFWNSDNSTCTEFWKFYNDIPVTVTHCVFFALSCAVKLLQQHHLCKM